MSEKMKNVYSLMGYNGTAYEMGYFTNIHKMLEVGATYENSYFSAHVLNKNYQDNYIHINQFKNGSVDSDDITYIYVVLLWFKNGVINSGIHLGFADNISDCWNIIKEYHYLYQDVWPIDEDNDPRHKLDYSEHCGLSKDIYDCIDNNTQILIYTFPTNIMNGTKLSQSATKTMKFPFSEIENMSHNTDATLRMLSEKLKD